MVFTSELETYIDGSLALIDLEIGYTLDEWFNYEDGAALLTIQHKLVDVRNMLKDPAWKPAEVFPHIESMERMLDICQALKPEQEAFKGLEGDFDLILSDIAGSSMSETMSFWPDVNDEGPE